VLNRLRKRLSYANIIASLALFIALGGVGYAATASKNSVKSTSIKDGQVKTADLASNAVTSPKIKNGQVTNADLAANAVNSAKIANGSVAVADLAAGAAATALSANGADQVFLNQPALKETVSLALPSAGTYLVLADATAFAYDLTLGSDAQMDFVLAAGGTAIKSQNIFMSLDFSTAGGAAAYPWQHVAVINATAPLTITLSAKPATGNTAIDLRVRAPRLVAVRIAGATSPTVVP